MCDGDSQGTMREHDRAGRRRLRRRVITLGEVMSDPEQLPYDSPYWLRELAGDEPRVRIAPLRQGPTLRPQASRLSRRPTIGLPRRPAAGEWLLPRPGDG
jgi:hypothetical protein